MTMLRLSVREAQASFFDRPAVQRAMDRASRRALSKGGAFIRQRARTSIRSRKAISKPGQPPSSHTKLLKKFLFFAWDQSSKSVVIGPAKLNKAGNAPEVLEHGGEGEFRGPAMIRRRAHYKARPFMRPALEKEAPQLPGLFAGQLKG